MSGCHVVHTELCIHTKIRGFCEFCVIEDLQKKCIELQTRVDSLHEFRLNQISINKKIDSFVHEQENGLMIHKDRIRGLQLRCNEYDKDIHGINEKLDAWNEDFECLDSLHEFKLNQITANQKVEKTSRDNYDRLSFFIDSIHVELNKIKEKIACLMQKSSLNHEKRPFSCPTCEGRAYIWTTNSMNVLVSDNCKSCNGTGIVWG